MGEKPELEHRSGSDLKDRNVAVEVIPDGWSANKKCALSSALFRRVEVPLALK
jgi:hypothetical protein